MIRVLILLGLLVPVPSLAQGIIYSDLQTENCLASLEEGEALSLCAGQSADACINSDNGYSTVGMSGCLDAERKFWDAVLNSTYQAVLDTAKAADAQAPASSPNIPQQVPALRAMQRAWVTFRDEACTYERTTWGGGTGGGPATLRCLMELTAAQVDILSHQRGG